MSQLVRTVPRVGLLAVALALLFLAEMAVAVPQLADARQFCYGDRYKAYYAYEVCNQSNPHSITYVQMTGYSGSDYVCAAKGYSASTNTTLDGSWACGTGQGYHYYNGEANRYA